MQYLSAAPTDATVDFGTNTITRTDGGDWSGFHSGMLITIDSNGTETQNATNLNVFYTLASDPYKDGSGHWVLQVTGALIPENNKAVLVAPVVVDPTFQATQLANSATSEAVSAHFVANGFDPTTGDPVPGQIVRDGIGSWITDGFQVGDVLQVTGSLSNSTGTGANANGLTYRITKVTDDTITLSNTDVIIAEGTQNITLYRGKVPSVTYIKVEQISAFNVYATGTVDVTAGKGVFLNTGEVNGGFSDIRVGQVIAGNGADNYGDNIRLKSKESIVDAIGGGNILTPNIEGHDVILEAANGTIGDAFGGHPITIGDMNNGGTVTARASGVVNLYEVAVSGYGPGDMNILSVFSSGADAYLTADNSILDPSHNVTTSGKAIQVEANNIHFDAINGTIGSLFGGQPDFIGVDAISTGGVGGSPGLVDATAKGDIYIFQTLLQPRRRDDHLSDRRRRSAGGAVDPRRSARCARWADPRLRQQHHPDRAERRHRAGRQQFRDLQPLCLRFGQERYDRGADGDRDRRSAEHLHHSEIQFEQPGPERPLPRYRHDRARHRRLPDRAARQHPQQRQAPRERAGRQHAPVRAR